MTRSVEGVPRLARILGRGSIVNGSLTFGRAADLLLYGVAILAVPWLATPFVVLVAPLARQIDPHDYWLQPTVHQLGSLLITLALARLVSTRAWAEWGFNLRRPACSLALAASFALLVTPLMYWLMQRQPKPGAPITPEEIAIVLFAHFFVISFTQEVLFRGFAMGILHQQWPRSAGLWAAIIFTLAHVKFAPPYVWPEQVIFAFVFGLAYAVMYARTGSLLGPTIAHGFSNTVFVVFLLLKYA